MSTEAYKAGMDALMNRYRAMFCDMDYATVDFSRSCVGILHIVNDLCTEEEYRDIYDRYQTLKRWFREDRERLKE